MAYTPIGRKTNKNSKINFTFFVLTSLLQSGKQVPPGQIKIGKY